MAWDNAEGSRKFKYVTSKWNLCWFKSDIISSNVIINRESHAVQCGCSALQPSLYKISYVFSVFLQVKHRMKIKGLEKKRFIFEDSDFEWIYWVTFSFQSCWPKKCCSKSATGTHQWPYNREWMAIFLVSSVSRGFTAISFQTMMPRPNLTTAWYFPSYFRFG